MERFGFTNYTREWWHYDHRDRGSRYLDIPLGLGLSAAQSTRVHTEGMTPRPEPMRVALAQINPTVGDIDGNAAKIADYTDRARDAGAALVVFPELTLSGYPPEDLLLKTHFLDATGVALEELAAGHARHRGPGGVSRARGRRLQLGGGPRGRPRGRRLSQVPPAQLRPLRRAALLPGGHRAGADRGERHLDRAHRVRGHLGARAAGQRGGARRRADDRQPVRLALPRGQGDRARADAGAARQGQHRVGGVLQHRRRPGRAGVRRPQRGDRPGRRRAGALAAVRGGAHASARSTRARSRPRDCATPATAPPRAGSARRCRCWPRSPSRSPAAPTRWAARWLRCSAPRRRCTRR